MKARRSKKAKKFLNEKQFKLILEAIRQGKVKQL